jgi:hypothetical protein
MNETKKSNGSPGEDWNEKGTMITTKELESEGTGTMKPWRPGSDKDEKYKR